MRGQALVATRRIAVSPESPKSIAERAADDRLDAVAGHLFGEFQRTEHVVGVGQRQRRLAVLFGKLRQARDRQRAFEQRIGRVDVQMNEAEFTRHVSRHSWSKRFRLAGDHDPASIAAELGPDRRGRGAVPRRLGPHCLSRSDPPNDFHRAKDGGWRACLSITAAR